MIVIAIIIMIADTHETIKKNKKNMTTSPRFTGSNLEQQQKKKMGQWIC